MRRDTQIERATERRRLIATLGLLTVVGACSESTGDLSVDAGRDGAPSGEVVSAVMVQGGDHTSVGWHYHIGSGAQRVLRIQADGRVTFLPPTPCEGYRVPLHGMLTAADLGRYQDLLHAQGDFVYLSDAVCPALALESFESLRILHETGVEERAGARPAFRPIPGCSPADQPVHPPGTLALTDWMRARMYDADFTARLAPGLSDVIRVTRVDRSLWESEGRPVPPAVPWTFAGVSLAALEARVRPQEREPYVDYTEADRDALWALCLAGYARWEEVTDPHDACMDVAVFAAEEGGQTWLLACGAPPVLEVLPLEVD